MLYDEVTRRLVRLEKEIPILEDKLQGYPKENIIVTGTVKSTKWYKTLNGEKEYIPKSEQSLASCLAAKKYLTKKLEELQEEKKALMQYLQKTGKNSADAMFSDYRYADLLRSQFTYHVPDIQQWLSEEYPRSHEYPERLVHKTYAGHMVRSKSEAMIANLLYMQRIPYRYECLLKLNGYDFYPDFTILHPKTKKIWYYEHFGRMDDADYVRKVSYKLGAYSQNGIFMGQNLVATYETEKSPLDIVLVEQLVQYYFE